MEWAEVQRRWRMLEAACLLVVSLALFATMALAMAMIPPLVIFGSLYLALAVLVYRMPANKWVAGLAGVLAIGGILSNLPFLVEDLSHPASWGSFIPNSISVVAGIGAAVAAVLSYRASSTSLVRPTSMALVGVSAALVVLSVVLTTTGSSDEPKMGDVRVSAEAFKYPEALTAKSGLVGLLVENKDAFHHTFVIEGQDAKVDMPASKARRLEVNLKAGKYTYLCDVPGHETMTGTLTVQ